MVVMSESMYVIQYRRGSQIDRMWSNHYEKDQNRGPEIDSESVAKIRLDELRERNLHRDDNSQTYAKYGKSVSTNYRLIKITTEVVDEDINFDPMV